MPRGRSKISQVGSTSPKSMRGRTGGLERAEVPTTPPMMRKSSYDADARAEEFSDAGFYDDDESTVEDGPSGSMYGAGESRNGKGVAGWYEQRR